MSQPDPITELLHAARNGSRQAFDAVFDRVYRELRDLAEGQRQRAAAQHTLGTTAIVHEAYLKLMKAQSISWQDRGHFFAVAATAMRQILLNHARQHLAGKRGGGRPLPLDDADAPVDCRVAELVELDGALTRLAALDPRLAQVVELRFFAGLSVKETGEALGLTERTIKRDWQAARAFLYEELHGEPPDG